MFWAVTTGVVILLISLLLLNYGPVNSMEFSLLDLKMRYRANHYNHDSLRPSKDIVILGIDANTDKYIRLHPESGLNTTIPRAKLAKVVNYLHQQGVRSIVFDLEFKDVKEGDAELAKAIAPFSYIYAADRMDHTLNVFEKYQMQPIERGQKRLAPEHFLEKGVLTPYLTYLADLRSRFMPWKSVSPLDLGAGPYYEPFPAIFQATYNQGLLSSISTKLNLQYDLYNQRLGHSSLSEPPKPRHENFQSMVERAFSELCIRDNYNQYYGNNPDYLRFLESKKLLLDLQKPMTDEAQRQLTYCYAFPMAKDLMPHITSIGVPSIDYDEDAYLRSITALYRSYKGNYYTYLGIRPALDLAGVQHIAYTPQALYLDQREIPLREGQKIFVNWRNPRLLLEQTLREHHIKPADAPELYESLKDVNPEKSNPMLNGGHIYRQISLIDVLMLAEGKSLSADAQGRMYNILYYPDSGEFSFKNKIVIIGNTLTDVHRTPISNTTFGPEVIAAAIDMFIHDHIFVKEPPVTAQWAVILLLSACIAVAIISFENLSIGLSIGILLIVTYWIVNLMAFVYWAYWLEVIIPSFVMIFSLGSSTLYRYYIHDQEKHHLTNVFSNYVSPQIMSEIMKNPARAMDNLKGGKKELTVLFSDLQGFTHQFENADPELMVSQLNEYFDAMTEIILAHGGTYDKYMGDSIMAFFGAPAEVPEHALMACKTAIEMQNALQRLNEGWAAEGSKILSHGIGLSSGEMFVGNFGSKNIKNFTVMGSNVNLGARLETYTRVAQWPIIISARTQELAKGSIECKDLGLIQVKGFTDNVQIYGLEGVNGIRAERNHPETPVISARPAAESTPNSL